MRVLPITFALSILAVASQARADYEAGAFGGLHVFSEVNRLGRYDLDPPSTAFTPSGIFGGRIGYLPIRYFGMELQIAATPTATKDDKTSATVLYFRGHVMGNLPIWRFRPFVLLGAGTATVIPNDPFYLRHNTELNLHGGVGIRFDVSALWGVRAEIQSAAVPRTDRDGFAFDHTFLFGVYGNFPWPPTPEEPFDKDHDQITDDKDECPDVAGDIRFGGCPDPDAAEDKSKAGEDADEKKADPKKDAEEKKP